jgi:uncharacterized cupredoxin-like copper-binding protein
MTGRTVRKLITGAGLLGAVVILAAFAANAQAAPERIVIRIHYSHFEPSAVRVPAGRPITFVLQNDDPIDHEWIVGDEQVHERHRTGTEPHHGDRPTEISLAPLSVQETTVTFDHPGRFLYICHLPGHETYGMVGVVEVH